MLLFIKINQAANFQDLWQHIKDYKVNLTDLEEFAYVHGETNLENALRIIRICSLYGPLSIELSSPQ